VLTLRYDADGHRHIEIPVFYEKGSYSNHAVDFIFDTGAYLTVLTRKTARRFGFDKIVPIRTNIPLTGFADSRCTGDMVAIPRMLIGGRMLGDVKVAVPHIDTEDDILGLNVLEHFNYLIDNTNDKIYFSDNAVYKAPNNLKCGRITAVSESTVICAVTLH
jgi:clan AA aspartic protease (TIGR02281 family)